MSDKFQFIKDAIESSLKIENQQSRESIEQDAKEYIEDAIDNPNQWRHNYSVKDKLQEKIKQYQTECDDKLSSLKENTYDKWDYSVWSLIPDKDDARISEKERNCILGFETSHYQFDEYVSNLFDDDETTKLDNDELNSLHNKLLYSIDLLYKNGSKEFKQQYRQALDNVSLFSSEVNLDEVVAIKKQKEILSSLDEEMDYSFPDFLDTFNHYEQEINEHFPDLVSLVDDIKSNLKSEDIFNQTSNETIFNLVDDNERFWNWFHTDESNANSLSYRLSMKDDDIPRLFYRGMNYIPDMDNVEVGSYSADGYNADYFSNRAVVGASYLDIADSDEDMGDPRLFSGFLRPADNPFVVPCNPKTVENWFQVKTANWNSVLQHYNMYQAMCLFEMAGFDDEIMKGDWQDAFGDKKVVDCETHYYTDAEQDDEGEWTKPVKVFTFFDLEKETGNLKAYEFIVNADYTEDDFRGKDGEIPSFVNETKLLISTNDMKANIQAQGRHDRVYFLDCTDIGGGTLSDAIPTAEQRSMIVAAWNFDNTSYGKSYFKEVRNNGNFDPNDNRIFYSLFDIEEDFKQEVKTEKEKTMENQVSGSPKAEQEPYTPKYNKYIADYIRDFVNDDRNFVAFRGDKVKLTGMANWYDLEKLAQRSGGIEHFAKLFDQYKSRNRLEMGQTWRYRYMNETIEMLRNPVAYQDKLEKSISGIQQRVTELYAQIDQENADTEKRDDLKSIKDGLLRAVVMENKRLAVVKDYLQTQQHRQEKQTMQQTQATQQTAAQGGVFLPKNPENTANYDLRGLPEFSSSLAAYFNNPERQALVLEFLKTAERSKDLRSQAFLNISYEEQKQFNRIAAFSPLELSAILDCKPEFADNLREYVAVVEDFELNNQQQLAAHKKAEDALRISPAYQEMNDRRKNWARIDLRREYIDGGHNYAFEKTGEITNGDRLKQAIANAIDAIAPAVKYSLSQTEFWQERDDKAFIKQSQIRDLLRSQMSFPAEMVEVKTLHQIWNDDRDMHDTISKSTAGFFTPKNGKTVVIADAFIDNPELAVFTAYHELGHRGIELQGRELWNEWLEKARQNPTVRAIADHTQTHYASKGNILSDIAATEEALVEVFAAYKTQKWDYLSERHNVEIPQEFRQPQGTAEKLWQSAKNKIGQIFGRQSETVSDAAVFAMLGKLEQSLYQFPEWKQKLEKTVRVGQHNPFVVAKQPIISGRPRVNPTALTNRYRSGGLRFDLNGQEQKMKTSQDILAEVMNKYEVHIDSKDGLMSKPLHWLSASELEDRRTVLSARIDKAIQYDDHETEERLELEYIKVENEKERRETLSDNLNEVMRKSQFETLSVREFTVLSESFDELLRQINKYDENSAIRETMRQELVAIKARMDGWKQPETLSIDDKLAMTEQKLRKINMDIEDRVYHYGANDKTVQNHIAYRTELLGDLETLKEQAAEKGGVPVPENTIKQDTFGLPEKPVHIDLDTTYSVAFPDEPNNPDANKTLGELMKQDDGVMWDAEFWGDRVGTGEMTVSENFITQVIATQRSEVMEEITTCGNVPFTKEHIEALYQREPELIKEVVDDYAVPEIKALAKEVVQTAENSLKHDLNPMPQAEEDDIAKRNEQVFGDLKTLSKEETGPFGLPIAEEERGMAAFDRALNSHLEDGKRLNQADEKVKNAEWERAKNPSDKARYDNLQAALAERDALNEEIKPRVQAAMDSGKPYIVDYSEDGKPLELVVTQSGTLRPALGSYDEEPKHNHLLCTINGEVALNAEQRSTPERVAEVLKYNFNHKHSDIGEKLALINYPAADKVFSGQEIKDTLNKALKSSSKDIRLDAIKSPVMRGEWLQSIAANPKATEEIRQAAKNEMAERYGTPETTVEQPTEKIGVSSPEHEEELATVADDDGYERD